MGFMDWLSGATDTKNEFTPTNFGNTEHYNANAFQYGGREGGAEAAAGRMQGLADSSYGTSAGLLGQQQGLMQQGQRFLDQSGGARMQQQDAARLMMARARGQTPSIAQMQADRQMGQAVAAQQAASASARGPAALALAQQQAANNIANAQSAISGQAQINAAQERLAAEQAAFGAFSGIRQGDFSGAGTAFGAGAQAGQLGLGFGQLGLGQDTLGHNIRSTQMQGQMQQQGLLAGSHQQGQQIASGVAGQNAQTNMGLLGGVAKAGEGALGVLTRASGGPIDPGQPYLVGEQGPELVVPSAPGLVIPAPQTSMMIANAGGPADTAASAGQALGGLFRPGTVGASGPAAASFDQLNKDGSMNVLGSLKAHSDFATRFAKNPAGGAQRGGM